jgi:hypothetical protein
MMIHVGFQSFDFQQAFEVPKPLNFASVEDALKWLRQLWSQHADLISRFREIVARYSGDMESSRLTDDQTIERLAMLLHSRRMVAISQGNRTAGGRPGPRAQLMAAAFPLAERRPRAAQMSQNQAKTWIAIELKDTDGNPVAGESYKLELPNGRIVNGKLDSMGMARVNDIDRGQCRVTFPRLDESTWALSGN